MTDTREWPARRAASTPQESWSNEAHCTWPAHPPSCLVVDDGLVVSDSCRREKQSEILRAEIRRYIRRFAVTSSLQNTCFRRWCTYTVATDAHSSIHQACFSTINRSHDCLCSTCRRIQIQWSPTIADKPHDACARHARFLYELHITSTSKCLPDQKYADYPHSSCTLVAKFTPTWPWVIKIKWREPLYLPYNQQLHLRHSTNREGRPQITNWYTGNVIMWCKVEVAPLDW